MKKAVTALVVADAHVETVGDMTFISTVVEIKNKKEVVTFTDSVTWTYLGTLNTEKAGA